ncbi:MAG: GGDEF domain-containing protein [Geothermobacteraceae bacterium]
MPLPDHFYRQMLDHLAEGVYFVDRNRRILYWNRAAEQLTGYRAEDLVEKCCADSGLDHIDCDLTPLCEGDCPLHRAMQGGRGISERVFLRHRDGHRLPVDVRTRPVYDDKGEIIGAIEIFSDASDRVRVENLNRQLQKQVRIDLLTGVPNRRAFLELAKAEFDRYQRYGEVFSVIFTDIDFFKQVNDRHGHRIGDRTLRWFADTLKTALRKVDTISRFGGEEFLILLPTTGAEEAVRTAEKLRRQLASDLCPTTGEPLSASFGVASVVAEDSTETLIERADRALYRSKQAGRNRVTYFGPGDVEEITVANATVRSGSSPPGADRER